MDKKAYMAPEMELIKLNNRATLLAGSFEEDDQPGWGGGAGGKDPD